MVKLFVRVETGFNHNKIITHLEIWRLKYICEFDYIVLIVVNGDGQGIELTKNVYLCEMLS
jgi:hypothetical protein